MPAVQEMNWVDFDALCEETDLALMPIGAVEVYGPHLPLGADGIATTALAARVAERVASLAGGVAAYSF
jgi:creatinine amidohydrolase